MTAPSPGFLAQVACVLEVTARKVGNVSRSHDFADCHLLDFLLSAGAIASPLDRVRELGIGRAIHDAVAATRAVTSTNTNLGMILLLAPLAAVEATEIAPLRAELEARLGRLTVDDADWVFRAIRNAAPGGLGQVDNHDVERPPTLDLRAAMRLAADRDLIARQFDNAFAEIFDLALPRLIDDLAHGKPLEPAIIHLHVALIAELGDSLIARKLGPQVANEAARRARIALQDGDLSPLDAWLREDGHRRNPGTTADLVAATLYLALRTGVIRLPLDHLVGGWS